MLPLFTAFAGGAKERPLPEYVKNAEWISVTVEDFDRTVRSHDAGEEIFIKVIPPKEGLDTTVLKKTLEDKSCHARVFLDISDCKKFSRTWYEPFDFRSSRCLTGIILPDSRNHVPFGTFWMCENLKTVCLPAKIESIGAGTFEGCTSLQYVYAGSLNDWLTKIRFRNEWANPLCYGAKLFCNGEEVTEIISDTCTAVLPYSFTGMGGLRKVSLPRVESIGDMAFSGCKNLEEVSLGSKLPTLGEKAFAGCTALSEISIPEGPSVLKETFAAVRPSKRLPFRKAYQSLKMHLLTVPHLLQSAVKAI